MSRLILLFFVVVSLVSSCDKNCPDTNPKLSISFTNYSKFDLEFSLFPKQEYLEGASLYELSDMGGGFSEKEFTLSQLNTENFMIDKRTVFITSDTSVFATNLFTMIFDSIHITVRANENTKIIFLPDTAINYIYNPYTNDSIWNNDFILVATPYSDCVNPQENKSYSFELTSELLGQ